MFPAPSGKQGYDAAFLAEVPADLTCMICTLVLRDPVQLDCGDRFCTPCFNNMVEYSERSGSEMLCPVDRQPVERDKIFSDKGAARVIKNLNVKCQNDELGCNWRGCLGDLESHESSCQYKTVPQIVQDTELKDLCKKLVERVQRCEENSVLKEKELAHLRFAIKEMKESISQNAELKELKEEVIYLKVTVKDMKDDSFKNKNEVATLKDSVTELGNKVETLKKENIDISMKYTNELEQLRRKSNYLDKELQNSKENISMQDSIELSKTNTNQQIALFHEKIEKKIDQTRDKSSGDIKNVNRQLENIRKEIRSNRSHLDKSITEKTNEINENTKEIEDLQNHVRCVENVEALFGSVVDNEVHFRWVMEDFKERYTHTVGEFIYSPVFYTNVVGYCFQLLIEWTEEKKKLGVYLQLHRGKNGKGKKLQPFHYEYTLKVIGKNDNTAERRILLKEVESEKEDCFFIPDALDVAKSIYGTADLITSPFDNYVFNDALYLTCTLHL